MFELCRNSRKKSDNKTLAVCTIGPTHDWSSGVYYYAKKEVERIGLKDGWDAVIVSGSDANEQSAQLIEFIEEEVDCIVLLPMDGAAVKTAAKAVQEAGIPPLILFDREIPDFAPTATVIGDNVAIGNVAAHALNDTFPMGTTVLELMGDASTVTFQRTNGFEEELSDRFSKKQVGYTDWQYDKVIQLFSNYLKKNSLEELEKVEAIYTHDDLIALGVLDVLDSYNSLNIKETPLPNLSIVVGISGSQAFLDRMDEEESYDLITLTYPPSMIVEAIRIGGEMIIMNEDYDEMTIISPEYIHMNNYEAYIDDMAPY